MFCFLPILFFTPSGQGRCLFQRECVRSWPLANQHESLRKKILTSSNSTFKVLNEETCCASVLIRGTVNVFTKIKHSLSHLFFLYRKVYTDLALLVLLQYLLKTTVRIHAGKHKHTHTTELCVGSQTVVTHVPWAAISYEGTGKSECND